MLKHNGRKLLLAVVVAGGAMAGTGCRQDMHDNPRFEAYESGSHRELPEGTIARGAIATNPGAPKSGQATPAPTPMTDGTSGMATPGATPAPAAAAIPTGEDGFPFRVTKAILDRGQNRYNISCLPCHGALGDGNGMIALRGIRRPPSYHDDRLRKAPSSYYYDVITNGFGAMSNYADQLTPEDRWKVIAYIRVLQLSQRAEGSLLSANDRQKLDESAHSASAKSDAHQAAGGHSNQ